MDVHKSRIGCELGWARHQQKLAHTKTGAWGGPHGAVRDLLYHAVIPAGVCEKWLCGRLARLDCNSCQFM